MLLSRVPISSPIVAFEDFASFEAIEGEVDSVFSLSIANSESKKQKLKFKYNSMLTALN